MTLGEIIARARRQHDLTPGALAELAGLSRISILEAERGRDPRRSTLEKLVAALPSLAPPDLLPARHPAVPPRPAAIAALDRAIAGGSARSVRIVLAPGAEPVVE